MINVTVIGKLYGTLVLAGRRAISADKNPDNLTVVPEKYKEQALAYMEYIAGVMESEK